MSVRFLSADKHTVDGRKKLWCLQLKSNHKPALSSNCGTPWISGCSSTPACFSLNREVGQRSEVVPVKCDVLVLLGWRCTDYKVQWWHSEQCKELSADKQKFYYWKQMSSKLPFSLWHHRKCRGVTTSCPTCKHSRSLDHVGKTEGSTNWSWEIRRRKTEQKNIDKKKHTNAWRSNTCWSTHCKKNIFNFCSVDWFLSLFLQLTFRIHVWIHF